MTPTIIAKNKEHLKILIEQEIEKNGNKCDLNHIDVSHIDNMSDLFSNSKFNGNISKWNVSNVKDMDFMFERSEFNNDISQWDVSNVIKMRCMFTNSYFNQDISAWNVSKVENMQFLFYKSLFNKDLSEWTPYKLSKKRNMEGIFSEYCEIPYWYNCDNSKERNNAIDKYQKTKKFNEELNNKLSDNNGLDKKMKI